MNKPRLKKCRVCGEKFRPFNSLAEACGIQCALIRGREKRAKDDKAINRAQKIAFNLRDTKWLKAKAQEVCNRYIRLRDAGMPCISCGTNNPNTQYAAGHFIPVSRCAALRYEEKNIHLQCNSYCNDHKSGNLLEYEKSLRLKLGDAIVEWLKGPHEKIRYRAEDYSRVITEYRLKIKQLKK